ncbi:type II toxin-antitoxin system RelE/ParE family toxin [Polynucleobacter sp. AP-RePozz3-80-G7]|uniref:type II toxin-antitoxin system RelE family toxin n=1 Tax=Polynucleobacter sp. AP-RePozz3-80-G7 TaxID=2689105 RepID=UPI001C0E3DC7|nr:type II toxin-antitoxin system RelE/ParE family toxin [Polynucleobacter sp. AP-RePozz3-80-G7]MBU3638488.1 type II toxin-antitoxin system RelE/ParE family toxin [Polynucleobacter sp. AP-RePozz3-80-G7]
MKSFSLEFHTLALKEWQKLDNSVKKQFKKQLQKRLVNPRAPSAKLHGDLDNFYKIKLRTVGYRLVYEVIDHKLVILVIAVGKRNQDAVYKNAENRK